MTKRVKRTQRLLPNAEALCNSNRKRPLRKRSTLCAAGLWLQQRSVGRGPVATLSPRPDGDGRAGSATAPAPALNLPQRPETNRVCRSTCRSSKKSSTRRGQAQRKPGVHRPGSQRATGLRTGRFLRRRLIRRKYVHKVDLDRRPCWRLCRCVCRAGPGRAGTAGLCARQQVLRSPSPYRRPILHRVTGALARQTWPDGGIGGDWLRDYEQIARGAGRGYVQVDETRSNIWNRPRKTGKAISGRAADRRGRGLSLGNQPGRGLSEQHHSGRFTASCNATATAIAPSPTSRQTAKSN